MNIYEGTSQLQVVAAINAVTKGTFLEQIKTYEAADYAPEMCAVKSKLTDLRVRFEEMVARDVYKRQAVRPARYATGLLREKSSHSAAIREAKSWKRSYSGCSMPSSRKPTGSTSETTYSRKNERDSIFKFFPARICSDLFRLCKKSAGKNFHNRLSPRNRPCS